MAKLSAHGHEVARYTRTAPVADESSIVSERTTVYAFMSDGAVLRKDSAVLRVVPEFGDSKLKWGWKLRHRKQTPEMLASFGADLERVGFVKVGRRSAEVDGSPAEE